MAVSQRQGAIAAFVVLLANVMTAVVVFGWLGPTVAADRDLLAGQVLGNPAPLLALELLKLVQAGATGTLVVALWVRLAAGSRGWARLARPLGWGGVGLLVASGVAGLVAVLLSMAAGSGPAPSGDLDAYQSITRVVNALGQGALLVGGLWHAANARAGQITTKLSRPLWLGGFALGAASVMAAVLGPLALVTLLISGGWHALLGVYLFRSPEAMTPTPVA